MKNVRRNMSRKAGCHYQQAALEALESRTLMSATPGIELCFDNPKTGLHVDFGTLAINVDNSGNVSVQLYQNTTITDNSYGTNAVGWGAGGHTLDQMINNDFAEFKFTDSKGHLVMDIKVDYLGVAAPGDLAHPSGYKSTYQVITGSGANVGFVDTSMDDNLNNVAFSNNGNMTNVGSDHINLTLNSPKVADANYTPNDGASFALWNFNSRYSVDVGAAAFGANGFGNVTVSVHDAPSKQGVTDITPYVCQDEGVGAGMTATIGFWHNKNGQALLKSLNGGPTATKLAAWLSGTFKNMYGFMGTGGPGGGAWTNTMVADFFLNADFSASGMKVDAQILGAAFAAYVTNSSLAGNTASSYGFIVNTHGTGAAEFNVGGNGEAFGVPDNTSLSVDELLLALDAYAKPATYNMTTHVYSDGLFGNYTGPSMSLSALLTEANVVFDGVNQKGDIK